MYHIKSKKIVISSLCCILTASPLLAGCGSFVPDAGSTMQISASSAGESGAFSTGRENDASVFAESAEPVSGTDMLFDTVVTITLYGADQQPYIDACFDLARQYENLFSNTIAESDISRINDAAGEFVEVSPETITLLNAGLEYGRISGGLFDITIGKLSDLWHFSDNDGTVPDAAEIAEAVSAIDDSAVVIDGTTAALTNPEAKIDLGGIAKGYIADRMRDYLEKEGITSGIINLGGNVVVLGSKPDGSPYKIGIQKPFADQNEIIAYVESDEISVVTSGVYERYFYVGDTLYHHILDPSTGYPADNGLLSVTIISKDSTDGDGLSTTCFLLGLEKGMELIENTPEVEAVFLTDDGEIHSTSGVGNRLVIVSE